MKEIEKVKAQKALLRIQEGDFDEGDVEMLLLRLRAYSGEHQIFREAADFVAHNDARDRGLTNYSLDNFYLSQKFINEYVVSNVRLDMTDEFPSYIKKLLKYQIAKCSAEELKAKYSSSSQRLQSMIDNVVKDVPGRKTCFIKPGLSNAKRETITKLLSYIRVEPVFTPDQLLEDLFAVLEKNKIDFVREKILENKSKFLLSFALLLHMTEFKLTGGLIARCLLRSERGWEPDDVDPNTILFGDLSVFGECLIETPELSYISTYRVFDTGLTAVDLCDATLVEPASHPQHSDYIGKVLNLERPLQMVDGKLYSI